MTQGHCCHCQPKLTVLSGAFHPQLARLVCEQLGVELGKARVGFHSDGDDDVQVIDTIRRHHVVIIQPFVKPLGLWLTELLVLIDAVRRASAEMITVVAPYFGGGRQERKSAPRMSITARLVADLLETAGADHVVLVDPHAESLQGFFKPAVPDQVSLLPLMIATNKLKGFEADEICYAGPDLHAAKSFAKKFLPHFPGARLAALAKERLGDSEIETMFLLGDVRGRRVAIIDDMATTLTTMVGARKVILEHGAQSVWSEAVHPVCVGRAWTNMLEGGFDEVAFSSTIPTPLEEAQALGDRLTIYNAALPISEAIQRIHDGRSISEIWKVRYWTERCGGDWRKLTITPEQNTSPSLGLWKAVEPHLAEVTLNKDLKIDDLIS